ncbi:MAG: RHS repeat-associated core domain-containing protein [candidate division Zixibacteria bacterium]|nr:RHS repeat-associated core domain-containing protein [candidate division Zixibacteria bacterium]
MQPMWTGVDSSSLDFLYEQTGQRIRKHYRYQYKQCESDTSEPGGPGGGGDGLGGDDTDDDSGGLLDGGGCEGIWVTYTVNDYIYYLYDEGILLATFDKNDSVIDLFINGPSGPICTYSKNDYTKMHYFLKDQINSNRVVMHMRTDTLTRQYVSEYINYQPFGGIIETYGSYDTPYRFTNKEHDQHSTFDYYYFGERYYNPRTGTFTSIDKAGQFASGYNYGGNNPIVGTDPDGNWFFAFAAIYAYNIISSYQQTHDFMLSFALTTMSTAKSYMAGSAASISSSNFSQFMKGKSDFLSNSALVSRNISMTTNWITKSIMNGEFQNGLKLDFGFGAHDFSSGHWDWADFGDGDWLSDIGGYQAYIQDVNRYGHLSAADRKRIDEIKEKYDTKDFAGNYEDYEGKWGVTTITQSEYDNLTGIGERFYNSRSIFDPLSWIPGVRKWVLNRVGIQRTGVHISGYRLPGGIAVTKDKDWIKGKSIGLRIHGNVDPTVYGLGSIGHGFETIFKLPQWMRREISSLYTIRYGFY